MAVLLASVECGSWARFLGVSALGAAEAYDRHTGRYAPALASAFVSFSGVRPGMRALDVGCGPGALAAELARLLGAERVCAVDPSEGYVEACVKRVPGADVRPGRAEALPFEDGAFDAVLAQLVVQVLDDPPGAACEMARVAVPAGIVATCVWDFEGGMLLLDAYWGAAEQVDPDGARQAAGGDSDPWCTPEGLRRLWDEAGLEGIEIGELSASADYEGFDDAWWSFGAGVSASGAYCRSLDEERRIAVREEFRRRLAAPAGRFTLTARAWSIRGRTP
jgi:SAM-dependent methyltransferase